MKRRGADDESSLELLLDTITNTFGGILFLAILIAILLQMSGRIEREAPAPLPQAELLALELRLDDARAHTAALRGTLAARQQIVADLAPQVSHEKLEAVKNLQANRDAQLSRRLAALKQLTAAQRAAESLRVDLTTLDEQLADSNERLATAQAALEREIESRTVDGRLPKTRATAKGQFGCLVRYGRLYFLEDSATGDLNRRDLDISESVLGRQVEPKPGRGVAIDGGDFPTVFAREFAECDPAEDYAAIAIWTDSFEQWALLRNRLVELGYEYQLVPLAADESVVLGGGGAAQVQ